MAAPWRNGYSLFLFGCKEVLKAECGKEINIPSKLYISLPVPTKKYGIELYTPEHL